MTVWDLRSDSLGDSNRVVDDEEVDFQRVASKENVVDVLNKRQHPAVLFFRMSGLRVDNLGKSSIRFEALEGQVLFRSAQTFSMVFTFTLVLVENPRAATMRREATFATLRQTAAVQRELRLLHLFPLRSLTFCGHGRRLYHTGRASSLKSHVHTPVTFRVCRQTGICLRGCVGFPDCCPTT